MNKQDIIQIAKSLTYEEFIDKYNTDSLCPSIYSLKDAETKQICKTIDCTYCWEKALTGIKFRGENEEDKQNDMMDEMWENELDTQQDLINGTR